MTNVWIMLHPQATPEHLGFLPEIISERYSGTVAEQLKTNYAHGGGYSPFGKKAWKFDPNDQSLKYPGDPRLRPIASTKIREEQIYFYDSAIMAIVQPDGEFDVVRVD